MKIKSMIQRITAILVFLVGLIFGILGLFGVNITVNQSDVNSIIFGLGAVIAGLIEVVPMLLSLVKDKKFRELMAVVNDVVWSVEELKGLTGPEKKQKAILAINKICEDRGIDFDEAQVDNMIESVIAIYNTVVKNQ